MAIHASRGTCLRIAALVLTGGVCAAFVQSPKRLRPTLGVEGELGYSVVDLGVASSVEALNDNGIAVGFLQVAPGTSRHIPLLWTNGASHPLAETGPGDGEARDINTARQIVGWSKDSNFDARPVRWTAGVPLDLGRLGTGTDGRALALNEFGWVVGWSQSSPGDLPQAFLADGVSMWLVGPPLPIRSEAHGINDRGQIVGFFVEPLEEERAFVWTNGVRRNLGGLTGFRDAEARDINDVGDIVGFCELAGLGCCEETRWRMESPMRDSWTPTGLGSPGVELNRAHGVNDFGDIVGDSFGRAFLWRDGTFLYLDDLLPEASDWTLLEARDINRFGQVVGVGLHAGLPRGYLLSPLPHLLVHDEGPANESIPATLASRPGDRFFVYRASRSGTAKVVADGIPVRLDIGSVDGDPLLVAEGTLGPSGGVTLNLAPAVRSERLYWQALIVADGRAYTSNRMETVIPGSLP
jgi:probable HAF family extracellular repeat protein